jgi:hypothetical protein
MIIKTFPYRTIVTLDNDADLSIHAYNGSGGNVIALGQGNMPDTSKQAEIENVDVLEGIGKVVAIRGLMSKYLFLEITGDGELELHYHVKRSAN